MNLPNQLTEREAIDPKLAVGSSLANPKGLLAVVLALYLVNDEKDYLDYSDSSGSSIILKPSLIALLKTFFNGVTGYNVTDIDSLASDNPLVEMQIEPLQVPLQLFWKIAKINILGSNSSSGERTGGVRFPKELLFTTNMDILKNVISNEDGDITNNGKELIYSWLTNKNTPTSSTNIELKLSKTLSIFSEETLFKTWDNSTEIIFQQEGIYNAFDTTNTTVDLGGTKEIKGTLRNLKSAIAKDIHPYLKISSSNVELKHPNLATEFQNYQQRVTNYLDLNPKSVEIKIVEAEDETNLVDVEILNKIYYGAPGTGKSHKVNELLKGKEERTERVTFHPEYDYASFIGGFKPITEKDAVSGKEEIKYKFVPQIFTNIYVDAWNNKDLQYYLVIEEINRGNCAEIFGDIFQLLDRNSDYNITPSNELKQYLVNELKSIDGLKGIENGKMKLPQNLNILATMNTSDQSLFPMDSAFKRRWDWEYIPINYEKSEENPSSNFQVYISETESFSWLDFIEKVNIVIKENPNLGMDKCIGNYFIKAKDNVITLEEFINKAIFYLWNDVFKDEDDHIFEENTFYEDFFPIATKGKEKVLKILDKIGLNKSEKED
jgi:MoxR-like ATPase